MGYTYEDGTWPPADVISYPGFDAQYWSHSATGTIGGAWRLLVNGVTIHTFSNAISYVGIPLRCLYAS